MSELRNQAAYSYPSPATNASPRTDISLREILDMYRDNHDLLKQILSAKSEEDKVKISVFFIYLGIIFKYILIFYELAFS